MKNILIIVGIITIGVIIESLVPNAIKTYISFITGIITGCWIMYNALETNK